MNIELGNQWIFIILGLAGVVILFIAIWLGFGSGGKNI